MEWTLYILRCADDSLYTGITNRLEERIKAHENGSGAKYTKGRGPFTLCYTEPCSDHSAALKREIAVKKLSRSEKLALAGNS